MIAEIKPAYAPQKLMADSILIVAGRGDDALYYHAQILNHDNDGALLVSFHSGSRLVERVQVFQNVDVRCVLENQEYEAILSVLDPAQHKNHDDIFLRLKIVRIALCDVFFEKRLVPMT